MGIIGKISSLIFIIMVITMCGNNRFLAAEPVNGQFNLNYTGFIYGALANIDDQNSLEHSILRLSKLSNIICSEPGELSDESKIVADTIKGTTNLFGYVHIGRSLDGAMENLNDVKKAIDRIAAEGWYGVFIDQFGYDFGGTRFDQNTIVKYAHDKGLKCFANAWFVDDALDGDTLLTEGDWYLCESFIRSSSRFRSDPDHIDKYIKAMNYSHGIHGTDTNLSCKGVQIACLSCRNEYYSWDDPATLADIKMSNILAKTLDFKGWWFCDDSLESNKLVYGSEPNIDIGNSIKIYLQKVNGNKYVAETEKYRIEFYAGSIPYMILNPLNASDPVVTIGTLPTEDQVDLYGLSANEKRELQQRINAYGFRDNNNDQLDEDGVFGEQSRQGLNNYLVANGYYYFSFNAKAELVGNNAINAEGRKGVLTPSDIITFDSSVYSERNKNYQRALNVLGYTDNDGNQLDEDGYFGTNSRNALNKFLSFNKYLYLGSAASTLLIQSAEPFLNPTVQLPSRQDQPAAKDWTIHLNQAVDQSTVHENTVYVMNSQNQKVSVTVTTESDGKSVLVKHPASGYLVGSYTLNVTTGVKTPSNIALQQAYQMLFNII